MDVGVFLRRAIAYTVLAAYILALYAIVWWLRGGFRAEVPTSSEIPSLRTSAPP